MKHVALSLAAMIHFFAAARRCSPAILLVLWMPAAVRAADFDKELLQAVKSNDAAACKAALAHGADINVRNAGSGCTPLMYAASCGYTDIVELLVDEGADIGCESFFTRSTALMIGAQRGDTLVVMLLLQAGADRDMMDCNGCRASDYVPLQDNQTALVLGARPAVSSGKRSRLHELEDTWLSTEKLMRMIRRATICRRQMELCPE
jgi:hypothetical protein